jgi:hypothetical protein
MKFKISNLVFHEKYGKGIINDKRFNLYDVEFENGTYSCEEHNLSSKKRKTKVSKVIKPLNKF